MTTEQKFEAALYLLADLWSKGEFTSNSGYLDSHGTESRLIDLCKTIAVECWGDAGQRLVVESNG
jgi:hypothetical protein